MSAFEQKKTEFTFVSARPQLAELNTRLQQTCPDYRMTLEPYRFVNTDTMAVYDPESSKSTYDIILCLNKDSRCISSVVGRYNASLRSMELLSKTEPEYEGRKFNLYLRTVFIWLMTYSRPSVAKIFSHSMNPISTYAMYKHFGATNDVLDYWAKIHTPNKTPEFFTIQDARTFHEYYKSTITQTPETAMLELENMIDNSLDILSEEDKPDPIPTAETITDEVCEMLFGKSKAETIQFIMETMNSYAITLAIHFTDENRESIKERMYTKLGSISIICMDDANQQLAKNPKPGGAKTKKAKKAKKAKKSKSRKSRQR